MSYSKMFIDLIDVDGLNPEEAFNIVVKHRQKHECTDIKQASCEDGADS